MIDARRILWLSTVFVLDVLIQKSGALEQGPAEHIFVQRPVDQPWLLADAE